MLTWHQSLFVDQERHKRDGREQFDGMDLLRSAASLMIVLFHAHSIASKHVNVGLGGLFSVPTWWYGCIELFFVMSGFLMVHMSYRLYGRKGGVYEFFLRRLARTPPLYYVYTFIVLAIFIAIPQLQDSKVTWERFICSIMFFPSETPPIIAIGWTLNYEVFFYIIVGLSIFVRYPLGPIFAILTICSLVILGLLFSPVPNPYALWTDPLLMNFAAGMSLAMLYYAGWSLTTRGRWLGLIVAITILYFLSPGFSPNDQMMRLIVLTPAISLIVAFFTLRSTAFKFFFGGNTVKAFGLRTYTLYLSHILSLKVVERVYFRFFDSVFFSYLYIVIGSAAAISIAYLLYPFIERPLGKWLRAQLVFQRPEKATA